MTTFQILTALALGLSAGACVADDLGATSSELASQPDGTGRSQHFYWAAYEDAPYIYKGCPEPGPQPWRAPAAIESKLGTEQIEVELGTAVALDIAVLEAPRDVELTPNPRGVSISVGDPFVGDPIPWKLRVSHESCSYELSAEITFR